MFKFKKLYASALAPQKKDGDCGYDLTALTRVETEAYIEYGTGLALEIPTGFAGLLFPRSSQSKYGMILANCVGVIDPSYRGEVKARFKKVGNGPEYQVGDRVVQLIIMPIHEPIWSETDTLSETGRGTGGFGSSGT